MKTLQMSKKPNQFFRNINAKIASIPMILTVLVVFLGGSIWTIFYSFTSSKLLPKWKFVGFDQYERLWETRRWIISIENLALYGIFSLIFTLFIGFTLAALLDRKIRFENTFRTILLYPFALSFIVTGLTWQGTGLIMVILLAGLRGIDEDIWRAARVDGIGTIKTYIRIIIPMMRPVFITALVLIAAGIIKIYDLVVAQTDGGPGIASEVPAKYVMNYMFGAQNLGQGFAASTMMLVSVIVILVPWAYLEFGGKRRA
jgi:glucose/mannose transport system permease protein